MEILQLLGVAVGLAALAGVNLYLTVFVCGLAIHYEWITLGPAYERLAVLGEPVVLWVAGTLFVIEFLADKIPWVDSLWDAAQTAVRPVGAAFLAVLVLGDAHPVFDVVVALLAAGLGLTTHLVKAGVRLQANASPEPVSNVVLSVSEDAAVVLGLALIYYHPVIALVVFVLVLASIFFVVPRLWRAVRATLWMCWRKLQLPPREAAVDELPRDLPPRALKGLSSRLPGAAELLWAVPCLGGRGLPRNRWGYVAALAGDERRLWFVDRRGRRSGVSALEIAELQVRHEPRFLCDAVRFATADGTVRYTVLFDRPSRALALRFADEAARRTR